jgi:alkanesulfonate monooxygenase SsuD/methylene tetrahydromethanopterin reductase-like flavin-dependent oxidoreductase (luciferase family)
MLRLAGERTDGTITWMTGPRALSEHVVPRITAAARAAGRTPPRVVCGLPVCVTSQPDAMRAIVEQICADHAALPSYRAMLDIEGARGAGDLAIVGDEAGVRAGMERVRAAGATDLLALVPGGPEEERRTLEVLRAADVRE